MGSSGLPTLTTYNYGVGLGVVGNLAGTIVGAFGIIFSTVIYFL